MAGKGEEVKVIGVWASSFVWRVQIAFNLKKVEYELVQEASWPQKSDLLLKSNPVYKKIPVLIHNGRPICESAIIVQYIDETWAASGPSILPPEPYDRAMARFWTAVMDDKLAAQFPILVGLVPGNVKEAAEQYATSLQLLEEAFKQCSKGKNFFGGDDIGYLDIAFGGHFGWMKAIEKIAGVKLLENEKIPHLVSWAERFSAHDAVKEVMPDPEKLAEFMTELKSELNIPAAN